MPLILGTNSIKDTGYDVENSCRYNITDQAYMHKTPGSAGNTGLKKYTFSTWVKRCGLASEQVLLRTKDGSNVENVMRFDGSGVIRLYAIGGGASLVTSAKYRDPGAWMHVVFAVDTTQGVAANRIKIYVNGTQVTSFSTETYPSADADMKICGDTMHIIGRVWNAGGDGGYGDFYLAETILIDGTQYAASDFGEFDSSSSRIWKPKESVEDLTFGTNGFYLDYKDSANLGNDSAGGTDLTEVNLAAVDQATDTPTNSFCTMNPLSSGSTMTEGNCQMDFPSSQQMSKGTFAVANGKWYWENKITVASNYPMLGITSVETAQAQNPAYTTYPGGAAGSYSAYGNGNVYANGSNTGSQSFTWATNDIIGIALDLDSGTKTIKWYKNNSEIATYNLTTTTDSWTPIDYNGGEGAVVCKYNFGGCSAFTVSSAQSDQNGYGNFEYAPPSGYYALNTQNLAEFGG